MNVRVTAALSLLIAASLALSGCGGSSKSNGSGGGTTIPSELVPASLASQAAQNPTQPYPSQSGNLPTVRLAAAVTGLQFASLDVARKMNFFGYLGVKVDFQQLTSDSQLAQAIIGKSVDIGMGSTNGYVNAVSAGADFQAVNLLVMQTGQICVRKDWAAAHNVTDQSDLKSRLLALKGATFGITAPKSSSETLVRLLFSKYAGLNPDKDARIITVGSSAADQAGIDANKIQAFAGSAPTCEGTQQGMVLIRSTDVPGFDNYMNEIAYGNSGWISGHADIVARVVDALAMGSNYTLKHTDQVLTIEHGLFPKVDAVTIDDGFKKSIVTAILPDGEFTQKMWDGTMSILKDIGVKTISTDQDKYWTNKYLNKKYTVVA